MCNSGIGALEVTAVPTCEVDPSRAEAREDRLAGMRTGREATWRRFREAERDKKEALKSAAVSRKALILDVIAVADEAEGALRRSRDGAKSKKQRHGPGDAEQLFDALCHALEHAGVHRVKIEGKKYNEVSFKGAVIPNPWEAVGVQSKNPFRAKDGTARRVVRSLWVYYTGTEVYVLRRGQVYY